MDRGRSEKYRYLEFNERYGRRHDARRARNIVKVIFKPEQKHDFIEDFNKRVGIRSTSTGILLFAISLIFLTGCSEIPGFDDEDYDAPVSASRNETVVIDSTGSQFENQLDSIVTPYFAAGGPGAAVLVTRNGTTVLSKGYGLADIANGRAITSANTFDLASVSKQITALANNAKMTETQRQEILTYCKAQYQENIAHWEAKNAEVSAFMSKIAADQTMTHEQKKEAIKAFFTQKKDDNKAYHEAQKQERKAFRKENKTQNSTSETLISN